MVKKKKILKRASALIVAALVGLVGIVPALIPCVGALGIQTEIFGRPDYVYPEIASPMVPFDELHNKLYGITIENPFLKMAIGADKSEGIPMDEELGLYYLSSDDDYSLVDWSFKRFSRLDLSDGLYMMSLSLDMSASTNRMSYSFSCGSSFVASLSELSKFFADCKYVVNPLYQYEANISVQGYYPRLINEGGWELVPFSASSSVNHSNTSSKAVEIFAFGALIYSGLPADIAFDRLVIVNDVVVDFELSASLSATTKDYFVPARQQSFSMPYSLNGFGHTFDEFYSEYPGRRVVVSDDPGATNFDLIVFLKNSVGSFLDTEIIPGLSFGGMLSTSIGISLVFVFLKFFGG